MSGESENCFVYLMTNPAMPVFCKIGRTSDIDERAKSLYQGHSGVPMPFNVIDVIELPNKDIAIKVEQKIHQIFAPNRVNPAREFFGPQNLEVETLLSTRDEFERLICQIRNIFQLVRISTSLDESSVSITRKSGESKKVTKSASKVHKVRELSNHPAAVKRRERLNGPNGDKYRLKEREANKRSRDKKKSTSV